MNVVGIDRTALARRIDSINRLIRAHAGAIELDAVDDDGCLHVRYTGMCTGCDFRPVTTAGTVEPALLDLPGVTQVEVAGHRTSDDATARIADAVEQGRAAQRAIRLVRRIEQSQEEPS
jgi:Fe-S cluster biogenesis protein NfuA